MPTVTASCANITEAFEELLSTLYACKNQYVLEQGAALVSEVEQRIDEWQGQIAQCKRSLKHFYASKEEQAKITEFKNFVKQFPATPVSPDADHDLHLTVKHIFAKAIKLFRNATRVDIYSDSRCSANPANIAGRQIKVWHSDWADMNAAQQKAVLDALKPFNCTVSVQTVKERKYWRGYYASIHRIA